MSLEHTVSETNPQISTLSTSFSSGHRRAQIVVALFALGLLLAIAMFATDFRQFDQMGRITHKLPITKSEISNNDRLIFALTVAWTIWYLSTIAAFLFWIHRAHRNLPALGATDLEFTPRSAVGWYFFPFANLFKPYQVMREIYNASNPASGIQESGYGFRQGAPLLVKCWWATFLLMGLSGRIADAGVRGADSAISLQIADVASMVFEAVAIVAILFATCLVRSIDNRQEARASTITIG